MQKIDSIELILSQLGYVRKTDTIGYHITLSKNISTFRHYLKPKDSMDRFFSFIGEEEATSNEGVLTAKKVYTSDAFFTHSIQYEAKHSQVEMPYIIQQGITAFLEEDIRAYQEEAKKSYAEPKKKNLIDFLVRNTIREVMFDYRRHDLFNSEDGYIKLLNLYLKKSLEIVGGDASAVKRFAILMEKSGFKNSQDLAIIAKDTTDTQLKLFLNFIQANEELGIVISDYKSAYNVFSSIDQSGFTD